MVAECLIASPRVVRIVIGVLRRFVLVKFTKRKFSGHD